MQYGFITGGPVDSLREDIAIAEDSPIGFLGLADSQFLIQELYTNLGVLALETETVEIGPSMTNPVTRHPAVHASAMCTVHELSDGRAVLGLASGDSAVHTLGKSPARLRDLEEAVTVIRRLSRGDTVTVDGNEIALEWLPDRRRDEFPIALAAEGPKTLELAGRVADRVVIGLGKIPAIVDQAVANIETGANAVDRSLADLDVWLYVDANVRTDGAVAIHEMKHSLAASAHHSLQVSFEGKCVPPDKETALRTLLEDYDPTVHGQPDETHNGALVERLGLTDYLADRYAVAGTPADCRTQLRQIARMDAVDGVLFAVHTGRKTAVMEQFATEVLPAV